MGWIKELEDAASKYKMLKWLIVSVLVVFLLAGLILLFNVAKRAWEGHAVKVASVELPEVPPDNKPVDSAFSLTPKTETPKTQLPPAAPQLRNRQEKENPKNGGSAAAPKYKFDNPKFYGPTQIGDSDVMIVNINGVRQREVSDRLIDNIIFKMGGNHPVINWALQTFDGESKNVFQQIKTKLNQRGYQLADGPDMLVMTCDTIDYGYDPGLPNKPFMILIPSTKNTQ